MRMPSVMSHNFSQVPQAEIQRSSFDRSHGYKTTFDGGFLVPVYVDEALPGDTFNLKMSAFARLATPLKPVMDNMFLDSFFFAVPVRLLWEHWKQFNGEQVSPGVTTSYNVPRIQAPNSGAGGVAVGSISDYMGIPTGVGSIYFNALHHRAYNLIWNEWFRDQNLQNPMTINVGDGPDPYTDYFLNRRGKRHDYFTSCLPWPQKGPDVPLPIGSSAPVKGIGKKTDLYSTSPQSVYENGGTVTYNYPSLIDPGSNDLSFYVSGSAQHGEPRIFADLSAATASTINALRQAFQLQRLYERDARGGTRYTEIIRAHFGVISPDARLQRPEFLGGGSTQINFHAVPQTSVSAATPQGNLAAFSTASAVGHGFTKSFTEHCVLLGLVSVRADLSYQQGLERMFSRRTRFDFYWPALSHIGEQAVLNQEIYCDGSANDALTFGYQERFAEYRYKPSKITGKFRSSASGTLDYWHLAQNFTSLPTLANTFILDTPPIARVVAVNTEPHFLFDAYFDLKCARPMPTYSVPGMIDHF